MPQDSCYSFPVQFIHLNRHHYQTFNHLVGLPPIAEEEIPIEYHATSGFVLDGHDISFSPKEQAGAAAEPTSPGKTRAKLKSAASGQEEKTSTDPEKKKMSTKRLMQTTLKIGADAIQRNMGEELQRPPELSTGQKIIPSRP